MIYNTKKIGITQPVNPYDLPYNEDQKINHELRLDLAHDRALWLDNFYKDFVIWIKNSHEVIGIYTTHPIHPYTRNKRLAVLYCLLSAGLWCSAATSYFLESNCDDDDINFEECLKNELLRGVGYTILWLIVFSPYKLLLISISKCYCAVETNGIFRSCCKKTSIAVSVLLFLFGMMLCYFGISLMLDLRSPREFAINFIVFYVLSVVFDIMKEFLLFIRQRKKDAENHEKLNTYTIRMIGDAVSYDIICVVCEGGMETNIPPETDFNCLHCNSVITV